MIDHLTGAPTGRKLLSALLSGLIAVLSFYTLATEPPRIFSEHGLWDFGAFIASGRAAANGLDPYGIYPPLTPHVVFPGFEAWNPNLNPPISAILFQALDWNDPSEAFAVWFWISAISYFGAVILLVRRYGRGLQAVLIFVWSMALAGYWDTLYLGQIYTPLVLATVAAWLLLENGKWIWAGFLMGLLVSLKPNFLVWPVLLLFAGYWRPSLICAATAAVVAMLPLMEFGPGIYLDWIKLVASDGARNVFLTNASLVGLFARAGFPMVGTGVAVLLLLGLSALTIVRKPPMPDISALALLASLLASPLGWIHYTLFLLAPIFHFWHLPLVRLASLSLVIPVPIVLAQFGKPLLIQLTVGSIYGWGLICLLAGPLANGRTIAAPDADDLRR